MADIPTGPSDFLSYAQLLGVNQGEVERLQKQAQDEYDASIGGASDALARARTQATNGGGDITQTASYGDFLRAQSQARDAYARLQSGAQMGSSFLDKTVGAASGLHADTGSGVDQLDQQQRNVQAGVDAQAKWGRDNAQATEAWKSNQAKLQADEAAKREAWRQQYVAGIQKNLGAASDAVKKQTGTIDPLKWLELFSTFGASAAWDPPGGFAANSGTQGRGDMVRRPDGSWANASGYSQQELARMKASLAKYGGDPNKSYNYDQQGHYEWGNWVADKKGG